jgi:hypothetical protein
MQAYKVIDANGMVWGIFNDKTVASGMALLRSFQTEDCEERSSYEVREEQIDGEVWAREGNQGKGTYEAKD